MSSKRPRWSTIPLVALLLLVAEARALAQPAAGAPAATVPERVELRYQGAESCPTERAFMSEVAARVQVPVEWVVSNPASLITVTLAQTDDHATGVLEVTRAPAEPTRREFMARSCGEVGSALALVVALTLDPNALTAPLPPPTPKAPPSPPSAPASVTPPPAPPPPPQVRAVAQPPPRAELRAARFVAWFGPAAGIAGGYAPRPLVTLGAALGIRALSSSLLKPSLQLAPLWGKTGSTGPSVSNASFGWAIGRLEGCPLALPVARPLVFVPCAAAEVGRLTARGADGKIEVPAAAERWWAAAGVSLSLHFSRGRWFTRLGSHALFPFTRDEFVFRDPNLLVHRAGVIVYGADLGLGVELGD